MREQIKKVMSETFGVPLSSIPDDVAFETLPQWDSLGQIQLMLAIELAFGVEITARAMTEAISLDTIEDFLKERGIR